VDRQARRGPLTQRMTRVSVTAMRKPPPPPPRPFSPVRERLFDVCLEEFRKHGFEQVPVSRITAAAGVAKGTFFNHFATKDHVLAEWLHRNVDQAMESVAGSRLAGGDAILSLFLAVADQFGEDRILASATILRIPVLPARMAGLPREEERLRSWIQDRLGEALPLRVPLCEPGHPMLSALLIWALRGALEDWVRSGAGSTRPLRGALREKGVFLLESSGLAVG